MVLEVCTTFYTTNSTLGVFEVVLLKTQVQYKVAVLNVS